MKKIIALTGGIGSGKSTVINILKDMGFKVFSADEEYKECLNDEAFVQKISDEFNISPIICCGKKCLDRAALSKIVFNDKEKKKLLDKMTHPVVVNRLIEKAKAASGTCVFCEVPLLFEGGFEKLFDGVIVVMRAESERINAVITRDGLRKDDVLKRIDSQLDYSKFNFDGYTVLWNDGNMHILYEKVKSIVDGLIKK